MASIEVRGANELIIDLREFPDKFQAKVINDMSQVAFDSAQKGAGRHIVTGALFQSLFNRAITGGRRVGHDELRAPHAKFVLHGTKRHDIVPKNKKALRWAGPNGFQFAKIVDHRGYKGDDYILDAQNEALNQFAAIVDDNLKESI